MVSVIFPLCVCVRVCLLTYIFFIIEKEALFVSACGKHNSSSDPGVLAPYTSPLPARVLFVVIVHIQTLLPVLLINL